MENASLLVLPPHLVDKIRDILVGELELPQELRSGLQDAVGAFDTAQVEEPVLLEKQVETDTQGDSDETIEKEEPHIPPPTIDITLVESLAKWSSSDGQAILESHNKDPSAYSLISLLSGTHLYLPPPQIALLKATETTDEDRKPNPYLPSHLSPRPSPFAGYKALQKQLSTALNVLFSIFGSGGAVYVAASTGAGWSREHSVVLGIIAGFVVGIAEIILVWILVWRVDTGRKMEPEHWKGSASDGPKAIPAVEGEKEVEGEQVVIPTPSTARKTTVRLRRRALA